MLNQALEPGELVVELGAGLRIAVRQVERCNRDTTDLGLDVAAVCIVRIARQSAADLVWLGFLGENRDPIEGALSVPDGAVARGANRHDRKRRIGRLQLLQ